MENILIENEGHKKELDDLLSEIDDELLSDEEAIIFDLENLLNKLSLSDKEKALQIIQIKYNSFSFYKKGNFPLQDKDLNKDFKMIYKELKEMRNEKQFNLMLQNSQFCQENSIPQIIFNNIAILQKLGKAIFEFVDLILILDRKENITDYRTLKLILPFIYEIDLEAQKKACSIIGSYLTKYLYQMQYLIDLLKEKNKSQYLEFQNEVQQAQLKLPLNNQQQIEKCNEYILLVKLLKLNPLNYQQHLDQYLCDNLKNQQQLSNKYITQQIECLFFKGLNISELFMIIIWYFWTQYFLDNAVINQELLSFDSNQKKITNDRKPLFYKRFVEKLTKSIKDEICFFYLNHWIFYCPQSENSLSREKLSIYLNEYQDSLINHQYSIKQFDIASLKLLEDQQLQDLISKEILQRNHLILWAYDINKFFFNKIKPLIINEQLNNITLFQELGNSFKGYEKFFIVNVLILVEEMRNFDQSKTQLLIKLILATKNLYQADQLLKFDEFINVHKQNKQLVQSIFHLTTKQWKLFSSFYPKNHVINSLTQILQNHLQEINSIDSTILNQLREISLIINSEESIYLKCFKILTKKIDPILLYVMFIQNIKFPLLSSAKITLITLNILHDQLSPLYQNYLFENLDKFFPHSFYNFKLIHELKTKNIDLSTIIKVVTVYYFKEKGEYQKLIDHCQLIFNYSQQFYQNWLEPLKYFDIFRITPSVLLRNQIISQYPQNMNITLEQFNQSIIELDDKEQARLVQDWIQNSQNQEKFLGLIPIFFNLIKRDGNPKQLLKFLNFSNSGHQQRIFNTKALFQILFNNADDELKVILLKFRSKESSIPFIFQELTNKNVVTKEEQLFALNHHLFYIFPESYSIMNMTLSKSNRQYGKTQLLNEIFYQFEKFEIGDQNDLNKNTIDIMFDFCFNGTRKFALADQHGQIPLSIFKKILPLFQLLIIQMHTEQELEENYEKVQAIKKELVTNPKICFIVRDSQINSQIEYKNIIDKIQLAAIDIHFIADLDEKGLDKQIRQMQIDLASKFLFSIIEQDYKFNSFVDHHNFISITKNFYPCNSKVIEQVNNDAQIINQIEAELERLLKLEQGFFSPEAFPFRALEYKILNLKLEMEATEFQKVQQQIEDLEKQKQYVKQTKILNLFNQILLSENYYILYLLIADKIRKFNQNSTFQLINENLQIQQERKKFLDEKEKIIDRNPEEKNQNQQNQKQLEKLLKKNQKDIQLKNMSVEIFWRESTNQQQYGQQENCYDSAFTLYEMLLKGEPIEFLDGDSLKINYQLLKQIANLFQKKGQERVLIMSVLGPQSAGKSTIYNKMFGCHLWTSVGKCTKGIFLQLLKVSNPEQYNNKIDYILLLDTEGLQSTTKKDPEFDKKIALFMLAISDIILIMVKGDINIQFRSLIEMCVYTLGQLQESFSCKKQLSWCFNQNNDTQINPFLEQISEIAKKMNEINAKSCMKNDLNYNDILAINTENIKVFGLSTEQKDWTQATQEFAKQWCIKVNTQNFSKEVQNFGLNLISNHIKKNQISHEQQQFSTLNKVIQLIESTWESIQSLPDLLEFSDLIHHQQNEKMRGEYDSIMDKEELMEQINIKQTIKSQISNQNEVTLKLLDSIAQNTIEEVSNILENTKTTLFERLNIFKQEERIQENIFMKYNQRLEQYIKTSISEFKIQILEEIQIQKREFQVNQGFALLDKFILSLGTDPVKLQQYQLNSKMIEDKFNEIWNEIDQELQNQSKKTFEEFQINQYQIMTQIFQYCLIRTENEKEFYHKILDIAKNNPIEDKYEKYEKYELFSSFRLELSKTQFTSLDGCLKNLRYQKTYNQPILQKIQNYNTDDLIDINKFFKYKVEWRWVDSKDLLNYVKGQMLKDLKRLLQSVNLQDHQIKQFFWILEEFGFRYEENIWNQLFMAIMNSSEDIVINQKFQEFTQAIEQGNNKKVFFENKTSISQILQLYPGLILTSCSKTFNQLKEVHQQREQLKLQYPLVMEFITVDSTEKSMEILNLLEKGQQQMKSNQTQTAQWFSQIMETQQGWSKLYCQFYDLIKKKVVDKYSTQDFNGSVQRNIINQSTMQMIMADVKQKIQDFNIYFSNYGIILNSLGERCIQHFSILIIWRFVCFYKWQEIQTQTKLSSIKVSEYSKFEAKIMQNKAELSRIRAKELLVNIKEGFLDKFYERKSISAKQQIDSEWISNQQLVKQLDQECFELINDQIKDPEKTYRYLSDQFSFILEYVQIKIYSIESKILETNEEELKNDLVIFLESILENSNNLNDQIKEGIKIKDFFNHKLIGQKNLEFYEQNLYNIVLNCLQGIEVQGDLIESTYQQMFSNGYKTLLNPIFIQESHRSDQKILDLKHFIQEFCHQLKQIINEIQQNPQLDKARLSITQNIDELQLDMIGCWEKCPMCNRKCDQNNIIHKKHSCQNGHQMRGINGIYINGQLSHQFCEEVDDDFKMLGEKQFRAVTQKLQRIQEFPDWQFTCFDENQFKFHKQRLEKIWNAGIGKKFCNIRNIPLQNNIQFSVLPINNLIIQQKPIHYIFVLDTSADMRGQNWENAKKAILNCLEIIKKIPDARVSIIFFGYFATLGIDCKTAGSISENIFDVRKYGFTRFSPPFEKIYSQINRYIDTISFESIAIVFYSDSVAEYPGKEMQMLKKIDITLCQKISFFISTYQQNQEFFIKIKGDLEQLNLRKIMLSNNISAKDLQFVWPELIRQINIQNE